MPGYSLKKPLFILLAAALALGMLIPLSAPQPAVAAGELDWVDAGGPGNGDAMALVADNQHGIIYRATVGSAGNTAFGKGVWKYQAGEWAPLGGETASMGIWTLAYDDAGDRLYAGSYGQGIWCYDPSDSTWTEMDFAMRSYDATALAFGGGKLYAGLKVNNSSTSKGVWCYDPADPSGGFTDTGGGVKDYRIHSLAWGEDRLYAGPEDFSTGWPLGVWYYDPASPNADKWTDTGGGMYHRRATALAWDGTNDLLYSAAGYTTAFRYDPASPDADKWTNIGGGFASFCVVSLAWGEGKLYAGTKEGSSAINRGVWCFDPSTSGWSDTGGGLNAYEMRSLAFDTVHHHLFAGTSQDGVWLYDLSNSPPTWSDTGGGVSTSYVNCLAYDTAGRLLYAGTDSDGVWCYDPVSDTWTDIGGGVATYETICLTFGGGRLYAGCYDHLTTYKGVWCYDPASPGPDKWTDTGLAAPAVHDLVYDEARGLLYAGTGEKYTDSGGQGVWCYDPAGPGWSDISAGDIGTYKTNSLALGGDTLYAGICDGSGIPSVYKGVWQYDLTNPSGGWTNTGGSMDGFEAYALTWDGARLYASRVDPTQPVYDSGDGVWWYDPTIPAPDKWTDTGGLLANSIVYDLAWDRENDRLYASCWYSFLGTWDGVWWYDPGAGEWGDTQGDIASYYVSSLVYDEELHRLYAGTGGEGAWYSGAPPAISHLDPTSGGEGSEVTVHGSCFGPGDTGSEYVTVGGVPAAVKPGTWTDTSLVCYVPAGVSGTAPVAVYNLNGASNQVDLQVIPSYDVTASVAGDGGDVSPPSQHVLQGGTATIDIIPDTGYHAATITDNGTPAAVDDPYVITDVQADHAVVVTFEPDPVPAGTFYFAEGTCRPGFEPYLCIQNPGATAAEVRITYMLGNGETTTRDLSVAPNSRSTVPVKAHLGEGDDEAHDFSARVETTNATQIVAERPMYFNYNGWCIGGHDVVGATSPAGTFYFAEGTCRPGFEPYLCIQNPGATAAEVRITYMLGSGETTTRDLSVAPNSRSTVPVKAHLGEGDDEAHDFSARVETTNATQIVAERPMYFNYNGWCIGGHDVVGATSPAGTFYFAEGTCRPGFEPYLCIQNPGATAAEVRITYMLGSGETTTRDISVAPNSRSTVPVKAHLGEGDDEAHDFSARVETTNATQIVAERPMYFNYNGWCIGGHDVVGATSPAGTFYFAEGTCRPGFEPYLCIQNPGATAAEVRITYMLGSGETTTRDLSVAPNSRSTVPVKAHLGEGDDEAHDFSARVETTNATQIVAERPMYFNYNGWCIGGHDVVGYVP